MDHFTKLSGNVKMVFDDELGPITAFVGRNRSGKTARLDAVRLALTGKHEVGAHGSNLMELAAPGATRLYTSLMGPAGSSSFAVETDNGQAKTPEPVARNGLVSQLTAAQLAHLLPTYSMADLISMGSVLSREAIFKRFGEVDKLPEPRAMTEAQKALWNECVAEVMASKKKADTAEVLSELAACCRRKKLSLGRDVKSREKVITEREETLKTVAAGVEELKALKAQLLTAQAWERAAALRADKLNIEQAIESYRERAKVVMDREERFKEMLAKLDYTVLDAKLKELEDAEAVLDTEHKRVAEYAVNGRVLMAICQHAKDNSSGPVACPLCQQGPWDIEATLEMLRPRVESRAQELGAIEDKVRVLITEHNNTQIERSSASVAFEEERRAIEAAKTTLRIDYASVTARRDTNAKALVDVPAEYTGPTAAELTARITPLESAEAALNALTEDTKALRALKLKHADAKTLEEEVTKELDNLLKKTADNASEVLARYTPNGFRIELDLGSAKWRVLGSDGQPHGKGAMAGSERGVLTFALALAWTEGMPMRIVLLDDADLGPFDPTTLTDVLAAFHASIQAGLLTQVFLAWSRPAELPDYVRKVYVDGNVPADGIAHVSSDMLSASKETYVEALL